MNKSERIFSLVWLGEKMLTDSDLEGVLDKAHQRNGFFTPEFSLLAIQSIANWLTKSSLEDWLGGVPENSKPHKIGIILAGNIPLVGWHDLMSVFVSGNISLYKPSQADEVLVDYLVGLHTTEFPKSKAFFEKRERLNDAEALIATGSKSTATHFNYYFRNVPRLIRSSRSSLGFIYGFETVAELDPLCDDILLYFGMGCRSITKVLVPEEYDFQNLFLAMEKYRYFANHNKFQNNAIYHQSIFLMNGDEFLHNDLILIRENQSLYSPPSVLHYEVYRSLDHAKEIVEGHRNDLQCMVSHQGQFPGSIPFGEAQKPGIADYADGINTLDFLLSL
jgi:hypothetical protein